MIPLSGSFRKSGWDYKLVSREGDVAVFEQTKPGLEFSVFEVVLVQRHNGYEIAGKRFPPAEHMPSSEQWGTLGFTCADRESAFIKADELQFR